jgi:MoaA/NifB/PqqE/SkfB family radical SAM enzyme
MSEQTVLLPDIQYHVEKIIEEVAKRGIAELELHIEVPVGKGRYGLWLRVKPT